MAERTTSVLLVDDHTAFAEAMRLAVDATPGLRSTGSAGSVAEAEAALADHLPDVVVLDLELPDATGAEAVEHLRAHHPDVDVLVLTGQCGGDVLAQVLRAGAAGVLGKDVPLATVLDAIRRLPHHAVLLDRAAVLAALRPAAPAPRPPPPGGVRLAPRERQILQLLADGLPPRAIADQLAIAVSTCRGYVKSVLVKLGAHSQIEAVSVARRRRLVD